MSEQTRGSKAMHYVASRYDLEVESTSWYDLVSESGVKYEVKSGMTKVRFWQDQHRSLTSCNVKGSAFYVIVQTTKSGGVIRHRKIRPPIVTAAVFNHGGWVKSGHDRTDAKEKYIPVSEFF